MRTVFCPVKGKEISGDDCFLIVQVADEWASPVVLPKGIRWDDEQCRKCKQCQYHADIVETK